MQRNVRPLARIAYPALLSLLGMLSATAGAACDWSRPGAAPYRGPGDPSAATAVESYTDIPPAIRAELARAIRGQHSDGIVYVRRDSLESPQGTVEGLRDMHWRGGLCLGAVDRSAWPADRVVPALLYRVEGYAVIVPVVCGNVARVQFTPHAGPVGTSGTGSQPLRVPEPPSFWLALAALGLLGVRRA